MTEQNTTPEAAATPAAPESAPANGKRKPVLLIIAAVFITIAVLYALYYFLIVQFREGTDDAYVNGNLVYINTQVSGTVVSLGADDTQSVKAGQMLVTLEGADSSVGLANAQASLAQTVRQTRQQFRSTDEGTERPTGDVA